MKETHGITHGSETLMALWMSSDPAREATLGHAATHAHRGEMAVLFGRGADRAAPIVSV